MAVPAEDYLDAADALLERLEEDALLSKRELEEVRRELTEAARDSGARALGAMATAAAGRARVLVPTSRNLRRANLAAERVRERFSAFRLQWLDKGEVRRLISEGFSKADQRTFFRHSNRLARNAKTFLRQIAELEPTLREEVDATIRQIEDARNDLLKLELRSWTTLRENLLRNIGGRQSRAKAREAIRQFDLNRNLYNLSLLEHPKAVVRDLLGQASEKMASRVAERRSLIPSRAFVFVGAGPGAVGRMTRGSRTAQILWRVFSQEELGRRFAELNRTRQAATSHRGLGLGFGTQEWYVPIPPESVEDVERAMRSRRREFLGGLEG